jgi:hypothetical protein
MPRFLSIDRVVVGGKHAGDSSARWDRVDVGGWSMVATESCSTALYWNELHRSADRDGRRRDSDVAYLFWSIFADRIVVSASASRCTQA